MNKALRTLGISAVLLTTGVSAVACGSPAPTSAASDNASYLLSSSRTETPPVAASASDRTPEGVAASLNDFFASVRNETSSALVSDKAESSPMPSTPEERASRMHKAYPQSLKHMDEGSLGIKREGSIIASLSVLGIMSATVTAEAKGISVDGDTAVVHPEALRVSTENTVRTNSGGSITLKYAQGAWLITNYSTGSSGE